jgi:hypothetical protein
MASKSVGFIKFVAMGEVAQISEFGKILVFIITGFVLVAATLFAGRLIAPKKPEQREANIIRVWRRANR